MSTRCSATIGIVAFVVLAAGTAVGQKPDLVVQKGHSAEIYSVAFSPNGKLLASGSLDNTIKLWEVATGKELRTMVVHAVISSLAFSPDGKLLASGSQEDKTIKLWEVATGKEVNGLVGADGVWTVAFSPNSKLLASLSLDDTVKLWDVATGKELSSLGVHSDIFFKEAIAFSSDGKLLAAGGAKNVIKLWDVATGKELGTLAGHYGNVESIAFSPDGTTLVSGSVESIRLWDVATGKELRKRSGNHVLSIAFNSAGKLLASAAGGENMVKLWDVETGKDQRSLVGHSSYVKAVAFNRDGTLLASGSDDKTIKVWDVATGAALLTLGGSSIQVVSVAFSPDGKLLANGNWDKTIQLWDVTSGRELRTLTGHYLPMSIAFSPDGKLLASGADNTAKVKVKGDDLLFSPAYPIELWEVGTGKVVHTLAGSSFDVKSIGFSPDGKLLVSVTSKDTSEVWNIATGIEMIAMVAHSSESIDLSPEGKLPARDRDADIVLLDATGKPLPAYTAYVVSPGGKLSASSEGNTIKLKDVETTLDLEKRQASDKTSDKKLRTLTGHSSPVISIAFNPDGKLLASGSYGTIKIWDVSTGKNLRTLIGHSHWVTSVAFSSNGKLLATGSYDKKVKLWDVATGKPLHTLTGHSSTVVSFAFNADGKLLASGSEDGKIKLWDIATGNELRTLVGPPSDVKSIGFSPDGRFLANMTMWWDVATGEELRTLALGRSSPVRSFSSDGRLLVRGTDDGTIKVWDVATGKLRTLVGKSELNTSISRRSPSVAFSPDGKFIASGASGSFSDKTIKLWDVATGEELRTLVGHSSAVSSFVFSPDGKILVSGSLDSTIRFWDVSAGKEIASFIALGPKDWAVVEPAGRFDASPGGMNLLHWVVGIEAIDLNQLKEGYYEPGLLAKLLGFNKEPLRDVSALRDVKLFPEVEYQLASAGSTKLNIKLSNRGGGIGPVQVLVNDKELIVDARPAGFNANQAQAVLTVDISSAPVISGQDNEIRVVARNQEGYLSSRGTKLAWSPTGTVDVTPPDLYAIVVGTSTYASPALELRYAAKDAGDMAKALELGAKRLFGAERVHLQLLSTDKSNPGAIAPTKANIRKAFEQVRKAKPQDIFVVYFAGHGVTLQQGSDTYLYLTQEARNADSATLADPGVREQTTISSEELVEWIKLVPALKQVMMLDTCAAGAAAGKLVEQRNVSGDQIRALDRLKDRTGFHVLMGSAADAVSYEASQYGQGVLTYALLQGLRGAALREDEYVDVQKLFQYAADEVPQLAQNIGGLQRPVVAAPRGTSFDVGRIGKEEKALIPLTMIKPVILRPILLNAEEQADTLDLIKELRKRLFDESAVLVRSGEHQLLVVYVDEDELPGAIRPSGTYTVEGERVQVTMVLRQDNQKIATLPLVEGTKNDVAGLIDKIMKTISAAITGLKP